MSGAAPAAVKVVFLRRNINRPFTYLVNKNKDFTGSPVVVPLGNQLTVGLVIEQLTSLPEDSENLKPVVCPVEKLQALPEDLIELGRWIADYYVAPVNRVFESIVPAKYLPQPFRKWEVLDQQRIGSSGVEPELKSFLEENESFEIAGIRKELPGKISSYVEKLNNLVEKNILKEEVKFESPAVDRRTLNYIQPAKPIPDDSELTSRQRELLEVVRKYNGCFQRELPDKLRRTDLLKKLAAEDLIRRTKRKLRRAPLPEIEPEAETTPPELTGEQEDIVDSVSPGEPGFESHLIHGVTGSGKTEVYFRLVEKTLRTGRTALVLVPEITLAVFMVERFRARFGDKLALLHSELSKGERRDEWRRIQEGEARVVLGVQSAVFAPLEDLGLIVVDEEHDSSYKAGQTPRYNARDSAVMRARLAEIPVVLGSATPGVESYANSLRGKYKLHRMVNRPTGGELPEVLLEDLRSASGVISGSLRRYTKEAFKNKNRAIWFLNRRGYSNFILCSNCGETVDCNNCSISLTPHSNPTQLRCHYCGYQRDIPDKCPDCGAEALQTPGVGTQQLARRAEEIYPSAKIIRMDADTVGKRKKRFELMEKFEENSPALLVGTQMVTKGLDFGKIDFVGVVNVDVGLNFPDFRAGEKTFQQLVQVCGRAGRAHRGARVLVQTYSPDHYAVQLGARGEYENFFSRELSYRKPLKYPPFARLVNVLARGRNEKQVSGALNNVRNQLPGREDIELLGPVPCGIDYLKGNYRWHLLARGNIDSEWKENLKKAVEASGGQVRLAVDVDPVDVL
ncbi:MAG: replication restart helicase PriA [bacterium]